LRKKDHLNSGSIEVICGSMFSGKTEELLNRIRQAQSESLKIAVYKPKIDTRYDSKNIVSHNKNYVEAMAITDPEEILNNDVDVIAIDEAQFFNNSLIKTVNILANKGIRIIIAGLDMDFQGVPFGPIPKLLAIAEKITKVHATCIDCGKEANYSFRKNTDSSLIKIGETHDYKALCRNCFNQSKMKN
tara:strand:+ start:181 stop:744 length:564 start_codon:yes stop_codon:yes gene_type:complete